MRPVPIFTGSVVAFVAVLLFAPSGHGEESPAKPAAVAKSDREIELEKKIESLQRQNETLRAELKAEREKRKAETLKRQQQQQRGIFRAPNGLFDVSPEYLKNVQPATPNSWVPREINGLRYYIVPLKAGR
jgi:hypothetical protein